MQHLDRFVNCDAHERMSKLSAFMQNGPPPPAPPLDSYTYPLTGFEYFHKA